MQIVAMGGHDRWHNRDAVAGLCERQQRVGGAALKRNMWLELSDAAGGVKCRAHGEAAIEEQKRIRCKAANIHHCVIRKLESTIAGRNKLQRGKPNRLERMIAGLNRSRGADRDVNLAAFEHRDQRSPNCLRQLDPYVGAMFRVTCQEHRQNAIDGLRRGRHLQNASVGPP